MNNTILAILHTLNIMAFVIEIATKSAVRVIALAIVLGEYTWTGAQVLYTNRQDILENANIFRNRIGSYFAYALFVTTMCANSFSGTNIYHCHLVRKLCEFSISKCGNHCPHFLSTNYIFIAEVFHGIFDEFHYFNCLRFARRVL